MSHSPNSPRLDIPVLDTISPALVRKTITTCERLLTSSNPIPLVLSREWARRFPTEAGVYAVFDNGTLIYLGETGSLSARMADFLDSRNHVLRRSLGNALFKDMDGFRRASAHERFPDHIEVRINEYIESQLTAAAVVVPLGRAEIEEQLAGKYRPPYNSKGKRGTKLYENASNRGQAMTSVVGSYRRAERTV